MTAVKKLEDRKFNYSDYITWEEDWEIIDGVAYAMSPSPVWEHQETASKIHGKFANYLEGKPCKVCYEFDVILSDEDIVRPDIMVICDKTKIDRKGIRGAPDLIIEILSPSTAKQDQIYKRDLYRKFGVKEYWIVDPIYKNIMVYYFNENNSISYFLETETEENFIPVGIFGGDLELDLKYIFES